MPNIEDFDRTLSRLERHSSLSDGDRGALRSLPHARAFVEAGAPLVREGCRAELCTLLLSGFAYRHKLTAQGQRQILAVHLPGEFVDLQHCLLDIADHNVQALTRAQVARIPIPALRGVLERRPAVAGALWLETLFEAALSREWVVNLGRRDSITRIAHLLCEFALRLRAAGLGDGQRYELPMTQEQIADCTGLTPVHVNRMLRQLGEMGLIERHRRFVGIRDWPALRRIGDFNSRYLHDAVEPVDLPRPRPLRGDYGSSAAA